MIGKNSRSASAREGDASPRTALWLLGLTTLVFFILLNVFKIQDVIARAAGYGGSIPMFKLDMTFNYTPEYCYGILSSYGQIGAKHTRSYFYQWMCYFRFSMERFSFC
jgi:succinate-acetate transporter protein